jgi:hypothetical protein
VVETFALNLMNRSQILVTVPKFMAHIYDFKIEPDYATKKGHDCMATAMARM